VRLLEEAVRIRSFVAAFVVVLVAASFTESHNEPGLTGWLLCLEPLLLIAWTLAWHTYRRALINRYETVEERESPDKTWIPDRFYISRGELRSMGFRPLAQIDSRYPWQPWGTGWASQDRFDTTIASVSGRPGVVFATYWPDGTVITTTNRAPRARVDLPEVRQLSLRAEAPQTYQLHRDACARWSAVHGEPIKIESAEKLISAGSLARSNMKKAFEVWTMRRSLIFTELAVCALAVALLALELIRIATPS
jgi:hypothetical protein